MSDIKRDDKPDGTSFDNFFENLGKKAEQLTIKDLAEKSTAPRATVNGEQPTTETVSATEDANEPKVVDEIESLCMNCYENVSPQ